MKVIFKIFLSVLLFFLLNTTVYATEFIHQFGAEVTSPYGQRTHPVTGELERMHWGIDLGIEMGAPLPAADSGYVSTGWQKGYGNWLQIDLDQGGAVLYGHLSGYATENGHVEKGQVVAYCGSTGESTGPHLHIEYHPNGYYVGGAVNPVDFLTSCGWTFTGRVGEGAQYSYVNNKKDEFAYLDSQLKFDWILAADTGKVVRQQLNSILEATKKAIKAINKYLVPLLYLFILIDFGATFLMMFLMKDTSDVNIFRYKHYNEVNLYLYVMFITCKYK